jgi:hypothetical protein
MATRTTKYSMHIYRRDINYQVASATFLSTRTPDCRGGLDSKLCLCQFIIIIIIHRISIAPNLQYSKALYIHTTLKIWTKPNLLVKKFKKFKNVT